MSIPMMSLDQFKDVFGADLYAEWTLEGYANYCDSTEFVEAMYAQYVAAYKEQADETN